MQAFGLLFHRQGCRSRLFDQRCVLLRALLHVRDRQIDLVDSGCLFVRRGGDLGHDLRNAIYRGKHFFHGAADLLHQAHAAIHLADRIADERLDLFGRVGRAMRKAAHFGRHDGKATALFAGARGLDGGIERQDVGLKRNRVDHADDIDDLARAFLDGIHGGDHRAEGLAALGRGRTGGIGQCIGFLRVFAILFHRRRHLFHARGSLFEGRRLLLGAPRQIGVAMRDLLGRGVNRFAAVADLGDHAHQAVIHVPQCCQQEAKLVSPIDVDAAPEITGSDRLGNPHRTGQRYGNAAHDKHRKQDRREQGHADYDEENIAALQITALHVAARVFLDFADGAHDGGVEMIELFVQHAVAIEHQPVDEEGTALFLAVVLLGRRQVAFAEFFVALGDAVHGGSLDSQFGNGALGDLQQRLHHTLLKVERRHVFFKIDARAAAQQGVFPFLVLDLEMDLRFAHRVDGFKNLLLGVKTLLQARAGGAYAIQPVAAHQHNARRHERGEQCQFERNLQVLEHVSSAKGVLIVY